MSNTASCIIKYITLKYVPSSDQNSKSTTFIIEYEHITLYTQRNKRETTKHTASVAGQVLECILWKQSLPFADKLEMNEKVELLLERKNHLPSE